MLLCLYPQLLLICLPISPPLPPRPGALFWPSMGFSLWKMLMKKAR